jgi:hypothetical protein
VPQGYPMGFAIPENIAKVLLRKAALKFLKQSLVVIFVTNKI